MKIHLGFIAACLMVALPTPAVAAQEGATTSAAPRADSVEIAREIIDLGMPEEKREAIFFATMEQMMAQMKEAQRQSNPIDDPQLMAIVERSLGEFKVKAIEKMSFHLPGIMEGWALAYASIFTKEELSDIRDFVSTPSGQRFFELSPAIAAEPNFAAANQLYMNDVMGLLPPMQEQLSADIMEYLSSLEAGDTAS